MTFTDHDRDRCHALSRFADEPAVAAALGELLADGQRTRLADACARLGRRDVVIAVLGQQGIGKSTLLNALLGRRVVPVDELETTNVVCGVRAADERGARIEIGFEDGRVLEGPVEEAWLGQFVDEQQNPKNEKGVARATVFADVPGLPAGFLLCDTPGVGASGSTESVTLGFLERISVGVFVLGTAPTLTASEARFLRLTWEHSRAFVFVQNVCVGQERVAEEAAEDNRRKLAEIAGLVGMPGTPKLLLVNAHRALEGVANDSPSDVEASGLPALRAEIDRTLAAGPAALLVQVEGQTIYAALTSAEAAGQQRIAALDAAESTSADTVRERIEAAREEISHLHASWAERKGSFESDAAADLDAAGELVRAAASRAAKAATEHLDAARMDAGRVARAFEEDLALELERVSRDISRRLDAHTRSVAADAVALGQEIDGACREAWRSAPGVAGAASASDVGEGVADAAKFVRNLATGVAGVMAVGFAVEAGAVLLAGEGLVAAVAAGVVAFPVIGWAIAGAVVVGAFVVHAGARAVVRSKMLAAIDQSASDAAARTTEAIQAAGRGHVAKVVARLDAMMAGVRDQQARTLAAIEADAARSQAERTTLRASLTGLLATLESARLRVEELLASREVPS